MADVNKDLLSVLKWVKAGLEEHYTLKSTLLGPGHASEVNYLGRTIRYSENGVEVEHNAKHVADLTGTLGMSTCR